MHSKRHTTAAAPIAIVRLALNIQRSKVENRKPGQISSEILSTSPQSVLVFLRWGAHNSLQQSSNQRQQGTQNERKSHWAGLLSSGHNPSGHWACNNNTTHISSPTVWKNLYSHGRTSKKICKWHQSYRGDEAVAVQIGIVSSHSLGQTANALSKVEINQRNQSQHFEESGIYIQTVCGAGCALGLSRLVRVPVCVQKKSQGELAA